MREHRRQLPRGLVTLVVLLMCLALGVTGASAGPKPVPHCITPTNVDLNERYGVDETILASFGPGVPACDKLKSGRRWTVSSAWFMNPAGFEFVPEVFVPAPGALTPLEDYIAKFVGVKYVVDADTAQQKIYMLPNNDSLGVILNQDGLFDIANPVTLGTVKPLSVGQHTVDTYLVFSAMHCDGFGDVLDENCLDGEVFYSRVLVTVTPGHN